MAVPAHPFNVVVDDSLCNISSLSEFQGIVQKKVLSLVNDFEDGKWRYPKFRNYIWDNVAQTALSEKERASLANKSHSILAEAAKNLRLTDNDKVGEGSEIAEIFLYGVMKDHFGALPVVPKIFYKQNTKDNAKGADSVHIVVNGDDFSIWLGEAKFYNSIEDKRLDAVVNSVLELLNTDKLKKENSIITNVSDINDLPLPGNMRENIIKSINSIHSIDTIKDKINVPIMLLHECEITSNSNIFDDAYVENMCNFHKNRAAAYFKKQIVKSSSVFLYEKIKFHIILFPVPNRAKIVDDFIGKVKSYVED